MKNRETIAEVCKRAESENPHIKSAVFRAMNAKSAVIVNFPVENFALKGVIDDIEPDQQGLYISMVTDSETDVYEIPQEAARDPARKRNSTPGWIDVYVKDCLNGTNFLTNDSEYDFFSILNELYLNAAKHGNKAGRPEKDVSWFERRNEQVPANMADNIGKPVGIHALIAPQLILVRTVDTGNGCDVAKCTQLGTDNVLTAASGRGLYILKAQNADSVNGYRTEGGFAAYAMKKYKAARKEDE